MLTKITAYFYIDLSKITMISKNKKSLCIFASEISESSIEIEIDDVEGITIFLNKLDEYLTGKKLPDQPLPPTDRIDRTIPQSALDKYKKD